MQTLHTSLSLTLIDMTRYKDLKISEKCHCSHNNNTDLLKQISIFDTTKDNTVLSLDTTLVITKPKFQLKI